MGCRDDADVNHREWKKRRTLFLLEPTSCLLKHGQEHGCGQRPADVETDRSRYIHFQREREPGAEHLCLLYLRLVGLRER